MTKTTKKLEFTNTIGAKSKTRLREKEDYYATDPKAVAMLLEIEDFEGSIWECACGEGHLSKEMEKMGYDVLSTDLINRGYGKKMDFLAQTKKTDRHIITNPPYKLTSEFILKAIELLQKGKKLALFLPIRYLEGKSRKTIFEKYPPKVIHVSSGRLNTARNGNFKQYNASYIGFAWFVWQKGYKKDTIIKWFN